MAHFRPFTPFSLTRNKESTHYFRFFYNFGTYFSILFTVIDYILYLFNFFKREQKSRQDESAQKDQEGCETVGEAQRFSRIVRANLRPGLEIVDNLLGRASLAQFLEVVVERAKQGRALLETVSVRLEVVLLRQGDNLTIRVLSQGPSNKNKNIYLCHKNGLLRSNSTAK
jgi:hypothetical protein